MCVGLCLAGAVTIILTGRSRALSLTPETARKAQINDYLSAALMLGMAVGVGALIVARLYWI